MPIDRLLDPSKLPARPAPHSPLGLKIENERLQNEINNLNNKVFIDGLTKTYNRQALELEVERLSHSRYPVHLFLFDIDNFKKLNDQYGHDQGDKILVDYAGILKKSFRESDFVCRYGGDEMLVLMRNEQDLIPNEKIFELKKEEILQKLQEVNDQRKSKDLPQFVFSIGHQTYKPESGENYTNAFKQADSKLYQQKKAKRASD